MDTRININNSYLEYSKEILNAISYEPEIIHILLEKLGITTQQFYNYLSGNEIASIEFYINALEIAKELTKKDVKVYKKQ